ncbi:hypothetical protein CLAFUW4_07231 [Fulvia fulva]|uniref:Apple domain-containing protein n=1 Tax=Passalora fulva TaxID=5499 RepID=A0A9Q8PBE8_PASFU|nr:uncharacterized protein CLAFUR5_07363 [Fulvia fulva]KAK4622113.1 hypothetical protein CLAFUR4_07239 [Fulvia fulva]KAK4622596.1 hypothetical protein CLAFUR0_07236 [Fulvia fulva]UJO19385.1 hypothetical protein CLAFUR5_07363 [Fulvia fulva]WPV16111.1 hypothetical protein CLAFUW4_07231 [Fulvia fulva]WPV31561.1 hypothetical protein CLAFUW7_07232 [Fulvia fulva]
MKSAFTAAALLAASAASALADPIFPRAAVPEEELAFSTKAARAATCELTDTLCPACDATNITSAAGITYAVSCGWQFETTTEDEVEGDTSTHICLEACEESENDCSGVNMLANGSCIIATGQTQGLRRVPGVTHLLRLPRSEPKPTTSTIGSPFPAPTNADARCNLTLTNLCPACNGREVESEHGDKYTLLCDSDLDSTDSYSPQDWMSPGECLDTCDDLDFCKGTMYYDDRNCEIAKDDDLRPVSRAGYTAFLPVSTKTASSAVTSLTLSTSTTKPKSSVPSVALPTGKPSGRPMHPPPAGYGATSVTSSEEPTFSILPIGSGCNSNALACPQCDGVPYLDQLNGSYTVLCGMEPTCESTVIFPDGAEDVEECLQNCDQDVTCIAAMWYPGYKECHGCKQGMETKNKKDLPYILLAADIDGEDDSTLTQTLRESTSAPTVASTARSISDLPAPFPWPTGTGPVGPVVVSSLPSPAVEVTVSKSLLLTATSASGAIRLTTSSIPAQVTNIGELICPGADNEVYVEPSSGNYFAVNCDSVFSAAHSSYTSASDLADCVASCTGDCDGVQFGYSTRCGLYTDISVLQTATGWTVAASITHPATDATASATVSEDVSDSAVPTASSPWIPYGNITSRH